MAIGVFNRDKVYHNVEPGEAFLESDALNGKNLYSTSKTATESVTKAWQQIAMVSGD